jgi:hypothetical protein
MKYRIFLKNGKSVLTDEIFTSDWIFPHIVVENTSVEGTEYKKVRIPISSVLMISEDKK